MTLCRDLRGQWQGPIVLLTSLDSDMNHILSPEMGASDYILKTTPPAVLLARLRLHLRQHIAPAGAGAPATLTPHKTISFGSLTIDPVNRRAARRRKRRPVYRRFRPAVGAGYPRRADYGPRRPAEKFTRRHLRRDGSQRRRRHLAPAQKLLDNATEPYRIKTVRNKGYLFAPTHGTTERSFCGPERARFTA